MCLADSRMFLPGLNLTYTDRASMAASTEVRVPFVDPEVFRAAFSLSGQGQGLRGIPEVVSKRAAEAWLPKEIIHRPKASFSAPLRAWVCRDLKEVIDDSLLGGELVATGSLQRGRPSYCSRRGDRAGREDRSKQIWQLLDSGERGTARPAKRASGCDPSARKGIRSSVKQVAENYRSGGSRSLTPPPPVRPGGVLVIRSTP